MIAVAAVHAADDPRTYFGDEPVLVGQPIVDLNGNLTFNPDGTVATYSSSQITQAKRVQYFFISDLGTPGVQTIKLATPSLSNFKVTVDGRTLAASEYTLVGTLLTLRPTTWTQGTTSPSRTPAPCSTPAATRSTTTARPPR